MDASPEEHAEFIPQLMNILTDVIENDPREWAEACFAREDQSEPIFTLSFTIKLYSGVRDVFPRLADIGEMPNHILNVLFNQVYEFEQDEILDLWTLLVGDILEGATADMVQKTCQYLNDSMDAPRAQRAWSILCEYWVKTENDLEGTLALLGYPFTTESAKMMDDEELDMWETLVVSAVQNGDNALSTLEAITAHLTTCSEERYFYHLSTFLVVSSDCLYLQPKEAPGDVYASCIGVAISC